MLAVPVGAPETVEALRDEADEVVCLVQARADVGGRPLVRALRARPATMRSRDCWRARRARSSVAAAGDAPARCGSRSARELEIVGDLVLPEPAHGLVVFAHGSGSSRHSPRNRQVRASAQRASAGDAAARPADGRGGARSRERVRHRPARRAARRGDALGAGGAETRRTAGRLLRRQHRCRRGAVGGRGARRRDRRGRLARRPARPGSRAAARGATRRCC